MIPKCHMRDCDKPGIWAMASEDDSSPCYCLPHVGQAVLRMFGFGGGTPEAQEVLALYGLDEEGDE